MDYVCGCRGLIYERKERSLPRPQLTSHLPSSTHPQTEACSADAAWPPASPNKRAALRLLCDLLPARPPLAARAWVERTARTQLPQWCGGGAEETALVAPVVAVLLRAVATASEGEEGEGYPWLPAVVTALLSSSSVMGARVLGYRACDLLYYCRAWPVKLQEAVVGVVHAGGAEGGAGLVDYLVEVRECAFTYV